MYKMYVLVLNGSLGKTLHSVVTLINVSCIPIKLILQLVPLHSDSKLEHFVMCSEHVVCVYVCSGW